MVKGLNEKGLSKVDNVRVYAHSGATTYDLLDHINPIVRKQPDEIILHGGTNDITKNVDTIANTEKLIQLVKKKSPKTKLVISKIIIRKDRADLDKRIQEVNERLEKVCEVNQIGMINNSNLSDSHLSKSKLHLSRYGSYVFANNILSSLNN